LGIKGSESEGGGSGGYIRKIS